MKFFLNKPSPIFKFFFSEIVEGPKTNIILLKIILPESLVVYKSCLRRLYAFLCVFQNLMKRIWHSLRNFSFTYFVHNLYVCSLYLQHFYIHEKNNLNITTAKKVFWLKQYVPLGSFNALMHKYMEPISCISTALFVEDKESDWSTQV